MINDWRKRLESWINQLTHWQLIGLAFLVSLLVNIGIVWAVTILVK